MYKLLANPKRLEILNILKTGQATLSELTRIVGARKVNISQHLAVLRHLRLVEISERGREARYRLLNPKIVELCRTLKDLHRE